MFNPGVAELVLQVIVNYYQVLMRQPLVLPKKGLHRLPRKIHVGLRQPHNQVGERFKSHPLILL